MAGQRIVRGSITHARGARGTMRGVPWLHHRLAAHGGTNGKIWSGTRAAGAGGADPAEPRRGTGTSVDPRRRRRTVAHAGDGPVADQHGGRLPSVSVRHV